MQRPRAASDCRNCLRRPDNPLDHQDGTLSTTNRALVVCALNGSVKNLVADSLSEQHDADIETRDGDVGFIQKTSTPEESVLPDNQLCSRSDPVWGSVTIRVAYRTNNGSGKHSIGKFAASKIGCPTFDVGSS